MKIFSFLILFFSLSVVLAQDEAPVSPQIAIRIDAGDTAISNDINITFLEVLEDSRCPKDVVCVWAGQAKVKVLISGPDIEEKELELIVGKKDYNIIIDEEEFVLQAMGLTPYPTTQNMGNRDYALLVVQKNYD